MRTALYVLLALAAPAFAGQTVYKWVDEKGVTHFSDQPRSGAEKVELSSGSNRADSPPPAYTPSAPQESKAQSGPAYSRFVVESPQQDQAIINTGGKVTVQLSATPTVAPGHTVALYLDGAPVPDFGPTDLSYEFSNMPRGTHTVKAVISEKGRTIQETPPVTFHVRQETIFSKPPVGPTLRNKPPARASGNKLSTKQPSYAALNGGKAQFDPRTNMPVNTKPAAAVGPKAGN